MASRPRNINVTIGLGVAFILLGLLALPLALGNPGGSTGRGIPLWFALPGLWVGGISFVAYGLYWRRRDKTE